MMVGSDKNDEQVGDFAQQDDAASMPQKTVKKKVSKKKTVKKTTPKKKVTKKKSVKKKGVSKKKTISKTKATKVTPLPANESVDNSATDSAPDETKNQIETPKVSVAAISGDSAKRVTDPKITSESTQSVEANTSSAELIIKTHPNEEEEPMGASSSNTSGFWPKIIFWLIIVVIGFSYIRSLAKQPSAEAEAVEPAVSGTSSTKQTVSDKPNDVIELHVSKNEVVETTAESSSQVEPVQAIESDSPKTTEPSIEASEEITPQIQTEAMEAAEPSPKVDTVDKETATEVSDDSHSLRQKDTAGTAAVASPTMVDSEVVETPAEMSKPAEQVTQETEPRQGEDQEVSISAVAVEEQASTETVGADTPQSSQPVTEPAYSEQRAESVSKILKDFDELRNAAAAERKARQEKMRAYRESRMQRPPAYPTWGNSGARPYGPYGQTYYPYGYGYPQ